MHNLIETIARALVDSPDQVAVTDKDTVLELRVAPSDIGRVIGRQGRTVRSLRSILNAAGMKSNRRFTLEVIE
jgi:predicted RNA-binding protein YlqC (UPF0109 family)